MQINEDFLPLVISHKGNKKYINDDSIDHEGKVLKDVINAKADSSNVYTKEQLGDNLLPMTRIAGVYVGDDFTVTLSIEKSRPYIFINSHVFNREIILITTYDSNLINIDRIINMGSTDLSSFTLKDNKLTIKGAGRCRGFLYKLNYQMST